MVGRPHVVVIGAGFGGLEVARELTGQTVDVTVIDKRNHHTFQPLLYQVATAGLDSDDVCYATRGLFHRHDNVRAIQAHVEQINFDTRQVHTRVGEPISYDSLVIAAGAVTADFGVEGVAQHAFGLKSAAEAMQIRNHVLRNFERASRSTDPEEKLAATTVVIVGGGPTGVEMAGGFAELFNRVLQRDFSELDPSRARVILVEGQDRLLGTFAEKLGRNAQERLKSMGVDVRVSSTVQRVTPHSVEIDEATIASDTVIWAAGVKANPLAGKLGVETTRGGRVVVDDHLRIPGYDDVFVIGDLAAARLVDGDLVPQVAAGAIQAGKHVASTILGGLSGEETKGFNYRDKGSMATIGRNAAVVELPKGIHITGFLGWVAWLTLHLFMLIGFRNRANVLVNWAWNYLTYDRGSRLIIELDDDLAIEEGR